MKGLEWYLDAPRSQLPLPASPHHVEQPIRGTTRDPQSLGAASFQSSSFSGINNLWVSGFVETERAAPVDGDIGSFVDNLGNVGSIVIGAGTGLRRTSIMYMHTQRLRPGQIIRLGRVVIPDTFGQALKIDSLNEGVIRVRTTSLLRERPPSLRQLYLIAQTSSGEGLTIGEMTVMQLGDGYMEGIMTMCRNEVRLGDVLLDMSWSYFTIPVTTDRVEALRNCEAALGQGRRSRYYYREFQRSLEEASTGVRERLFMLQDFDNLDGDRERLAVDSTGSPPDGIEPTSRFVRRGYELTLEGRVGLASGRVVDGGKTGLGLGVFTNSSGRPGDTILGVPAILRSARVHLSFWVLNRQVREVTLGMRTMPRTDDMLFAERAIPPNAWTHVDTWLPWDGLSRGIGVFLGDVLGGGNEPVLIFDNVQISGGALPSTHLEGVPEAGFFDWRAGGSYTVYLSMSPRDTPSFVEVALQDGDRPLVSARPEQRASNQVPVTIHVPHGLARGQYRLFVRAGVTVPDSVRVDIRP